MNLDEKVMNLVVQEVGMFWTSVPSFRQPESFSKPISFEQAEYSHHLLRDVQLCLA